MNNTRNLWVDITDMWYWKGSFTGIQNVVDNYVEQFMQEGSIRLFLFEPEHRPFREVSYDEWRVKREDILKTDTTQVLNAVENRSILRTAHHYTAVVVKRIAPVPVKRYGRKKLNEYRARRIGAKSTTAVRHPFSPNDDVLIIGGNWGDDFRGFAEGLISVKQSVGIKLYHVVHDVMPLLYPNYYLPGSTKSFERYFSILAPAIDGYLTVSKATLEDLKRFLTKQGGANALSAVFRLGEDFPAVKKPERPPLPLEEGFILCVGTIEARKNQALLYSVVKLAQQRGISIPQIVIIGRKGWMAGDALHHLTADPDLKGKVIVSHTITDAQKSWLFKRCRFSIYPSYAEGWGLPVVEALHNGKLCLCSNLSSLPEAGGEYVSYISPYDANDVLEKIVYFMNPEHLAAKELQIASRPDYDWRQSFADFKVSFYGIRK